MSAQELPRTADKDEVGDNAVSELCAFCLFRDQGPKGQMDLACWLPVELS